MFRNICKIPKLLNHHFEHLMIYNDFIRSYYLFDQNQNEQFCEIMKRFRKQILANRIGGLTISIAMLFSMLIQYRWPSLCHYLSFSFCLYAKINPFSTGVLALTMTLWTFLIISINFFHPKRNESLKFLLPLNLNEKNHRIFEIKLPEASRYIKLRNITLRSCTVFIYTGLFLGCFIGTTLHIIKKRLIVEYSFWLISLAYLAYIYWILFASTYVHQTPIILILIKLFLGLKQNSLQQRINQFDNRFHRLKFETKSDAGISKEFDQINRAAINLGSEIALYNKQMQRYTTNIWFFFIALISILIYSLFIFDLAKNLIPIVSMLLQTHAIILIGFIFTASRIASNHKNYEIWNFRMNQLISFFNAQRSSNNRQRKSRWRKELKSIPISSDLIANPLSITLINDYPITSRTYIDVSHSDGEEKIE
ncbi:hypothetical protein SSS_01091 [Sarcoptes scabiei]|uniref:Uncharacterized protein n=1 Tax=Sarcoptes scabiei TaxID=52283 RepID=A0A834VF52_SARSC|nr:hypothetical protein SSS_01091 [Sarcoptes scabiei]